MAATLEIKVTSHLRDNYAARINRGLQMGGLAWQAEAKQYPPKMQGPWPGQLSVRSGNLGNGASYKIDLAARRVDLTAATYYRYLLLGTGLFGPKASLIYPASARVFAIPIASGGMLFTAYSRGSIWAGKLNRVKAALINGVRQGLSGPIE